MSGKSLANWENKAARKYVQRLVDDEFDGNVSRAADDLGISQSFLYEFLNERRGAGMKLLNAISARRGVPVDEILGRKIVLPFGPARTVVPGGNKGQAVEILLEAGEPPELVREAAEAVAAARSGDVDPPRWYWLKAIDAWMAIRKSARPVPALPAHDPETVEVPVKSDSGHPEAEVESLPSRRLRVPRVERGKVPKGAIDQRARAVHDKKRAK